MSLHDTTHFNCTIEGGIARISLNRPERKNPLTFDSYAELRDWFRALYETLLGSEQGPRMGSFISLYGVANTRTLIAEALARA